MSEQESNSDLQLNNILTQSFNKQDRSQSMQNPNHHVRFDNKSKMPSVPGSSEAKKRFVVSSLKQSNIASTLDTRVVGTLSPSFGKHFKISLLNSEKKKQQRNQSQLQTTREEIPLKPKQIQYTDSKSVEAWINDTLAEADSEGKIQRGNGLQRFGVDRKTLKTKGICQVNVDRVFRCLFVYSFGFHSMLSEILGHSNDCVTIVGQLWKVFGVLLEYCSRGDFMLTVNELERDKKLQVQKMQNQLLERDSKLKQQESWESERHHQLLAEIGQLQQQREMLLFEKTQLEDDFKQADSAFNEEVALRLQFEYRINEIHGIHRELVNKHQKLMEDFVLATQKEQRYERELVASKIIHETSIIDKRNLEIEIANVRVTSENMAQTLKHRDLQVKELDVKLSIVRKQDNREYFDQKDHEHSIQNTNLQILNLESIIQQKKLHSEEQEIQGIQMKENCTSLENRANQLEMEVQKYHTLFIEFQSKYNTTSRLEKSLRDQCELLRLEKTELQYANEQSTHAMKRLEVDLQFVQSKTGIQEREISMLNSNIQQMKTIKTKLDDEYMRERIKIDSLAGSVASKDDMIQELEKCISYLQERLHTYTTDLTESENKLRLREDDARVQQNAHKKKIDFLEICLLNERGELAKERERGISMSTEVDLQRSEVADLRSQLKTEVFERNNLSSKIIFLNRVIDNERTRNQEFLNDVTSLKIQLENSERDNKAHKISYYELTELHREEFTLQKQSYEFKIQMYKDVHQELMYKIYYEDALSQLMRLREKNLELNGSIGFLIKSNDLLTDKLKQQTIKNDSSHNKLEKQQFDLDALNFDITNTLKLRRLFKLIIMKLTNEYSQLQRQLQKSQLDNVELEKEIEQQTQKIKIIQLDSEKHEILIKRLRKDNLLNKTRADQSINQNIISENSDSKHIHSVSRESINRDQLIKQKEQFIIRPPKVETDRTLLNQNLSEASSSQNQKTNKQQMSEQSTSPHIKKQDFSFVNNVNEVEEQNSNRGKKRISKVINRKTSADVRGSRDKGDTVRNQKEHAISFQSTYLQKVTEQQEEVMNFDDGRRNRELQGINRQLGDTQQTHDMNNLKTPSRHDNHSQSKSHHNWRNINDIQQEDSKSDIKPIKKNIQSKPYDNREIARLIQIASTRYTK